MNQPNSEQLGMERSSQLSKGPTIDDREQENAAMGQSTNIRTIRGVPGTRACSPCDHRKCEHDGQGEDQSAWSAKYLVWTCISLPLHDACLKFDRISVPRASAYCSTRSVSSVCVPCFVSVHISYKCSHSEYWTCTRFAGFSALDRGICHFMACQVQVEPRGRKSCCAYAWTHRCLRNTLFCSHTDATIVNSSGSTPTPSTTSGKTLFAIRSGCGLDASRAGSGLNWAACLSLDLAAFVRTLYYTYCILGKIDNAKS
jgi:hypothetical protein